MNELKPARKPPIDHIERLICKEFKERGWTSQMLDDLLSLWFMHPIAQGIVTQEAAEKLAETFGTSVEFWVNLGKYNE